MIYLDEHKHSKSRFLQHETKTQNDPNLDIQFKGNGFTFKFKTL